MYMERHEPWKSVEILKLQNMTFTIDTPNENKHFLRCFPRNQR